jgi:protein-S-isoprenylcysteine O-methyltransferase Ste14
MQATRFEFEQRFWVIGAIFFAGFSTAWFDHTPAVDSFLHLFFPSLEIDSDRGHWLVRIVLFAATGLLVLAAMLRTWSTAYLLADVVHDTAQHSDYIVREGPYRHVRNPLYLAAILMAAGVGMMACRTGWFVIVIGITIFLYRLTFREEAGFLATRGDAFRDYCKAVPRMIPSPWPRLPAGDARPRWGQAFLGELFFWLFAVGMLALAITLNQKIAGLIFIATMPIYFIAATMAKRASRATRL